MQKEITTPVLFIIFNRLDTANRVMENIRKARPKKLYIASDGPRADVKNESEVVQHVRDSILKQIDWPCDVKTLFQTQNLGCKKSVSSAINWFFENVEEGIILEDDCVPDISFFEFCQELLEKYRFDEKIGAISGAKIEKNVVDDEDYFLSKVPRIWGWATWRRAWKKYDITMNAWPEFKKQNKIAQIWEPKKYQKYWNDVFDRTFRAEIGTWDYQLVFSFFENNLMCICPKVNLVSNIGFIQSSTHTNIINHDVSALPTQSIEFPLKHPAHLLYREHNDEYVHELYLKNFKIKSALRKFGIFSIVRKIYSFFVSK